MPKRFTDTEKWRDEWWGSLSNDYRMVWLYLVDSCSIAGIWKKDFRGLNFNCNTAITEEEFLKVFGARIIDKGNFFFIPKFVRFQCPKGLKSNKPAVVSIGKELLDNNLIETIVELYGNDYLIIKDKGKGKGKSKGIGTGEGKGNADQIYITVDDEVIYDPMPVLEFYEASLNGRQKEHSTRSWKDVVPEWFNQNVKIAFTDGKHVFNAFSKYLIGSGKPPIGTFKTPTTEKPTFEQINR
jgi:hypothetical protein